MRADENNRQKPANPVSRVRTSLHVARIIIIIVIFIDRARPRRLVIRSPKRAPLSLRRQRNIHPVFLLSSIRVK